jgi:hypothetical protein
VQFINGMAPDTVPVRDMARQVPQRMIRLLQRLAALKTGRYVIIFSVGPDGDMTWQLSEAGKVER